MQKHISKFFRYFSNPRKVKLLLCLMNDGYLYKRGWLNSILKNKIVDKDGQPLPWINYPAIDFLEQYLPANTNVFEYGGGFSTAYFSKRYNSVITVEHDPEWYKNVNELTSAFSNCTILLKEDKEDYINVIEKQQKKFYLIIIDGEWRNECLVKAISFLNGDGILLLDDSERSQYQNAIKSIKDKGFLAIPFTGMKPKSYEQHSTTIFLRK